MNGILFASHPCCLCTAEGQGRQPAARRRGPPRARARRRFISVRVCVCSGVPKVSFVSLQNVKKRQSNSYISTLRFHPPRGVENVMVLGHFWRLWTLRTSIWHRKTKGSATSIFAFYNLRFCICFIRFIPLLQKSKNAVRIRYATRGLEAPDVVRGPENEALETGHQMVPRRRFSLSAICDLP